MTPLVTEVQAMQNPALGAALVWRFACGHSPEHYASEGVPLPLAFIVLPIVLHARTREEVTATQAGSGFRKFEEKFKERGDLLLAINRRVVAMRPLSMRAVRLGVATGLLTLLSDRASLWPRTYTPPRGAAPSVQALLKAAEKLGAWCAPLSLFEIAGILRVEF